MAEALTSQQVIDISKQHTFGTWRRGKQWNPLHVVSADGCWFTDANGKRYLDFSAQLMCVNLGYNNQAVIQAIQQQAAELAYIQPSYTTNARAELSKALLEVLPAGLTKFFFSTSGTEAVEAALKIARLYTGKTKVIGRYRSYHGATATGMGATGDARRWPSEPRSKLPGVVFSPEVNCFKCPIRHTYPDCGIACAYYLEHMIQNEGDVAAVLCETVVGTNGVLIPPPGYYQKLRRICDENSVLLITDEVMAGWGRTGKWFAINHWDVQPDILTTAKGITSAYVPLGLTAVSKKIADFFEDNLFAHGHTYEAHPLTLGPAVATIREMQRLNLVDRAAEMGTYMGQKLNALKAKHPCIGEVRGLGLFWAIDLVKDQHLKTPFNTWQEKLDGKPLVVDQIAAKMMASGIFLQAWMSHFIIAPPLIITREEIDFALTALDEHLAIADALIS